jgi:hypothetical protein
MKITAEAPMATPSINPGRDCSGKPTGRSGLQGLRTGA